MNTNKILIVDDDPSIREVLEVLLTSEGFRVRMAEDGARAVDMVRENSDFDLIIMDIMMPVMSGVDACSKIREFSNVPVLFLTAKTRDVDKVNAYYKGGDDYIVKPFSKMELLAKVKAIIRRYTSYSTKTASADDMTIAGGISVNIEKRFVMKDDERIKLTDTEFEILKYLMEHRGETVKNQELYESVWGEKYMPSSGNTIMVHVLNLRKKLESHSNGEHIVKTVWGKGYTIE